VTWQSSAGRLVFRNRPFRRTLLAIILFGAALVTQATLHKLVFSLVIGSAEQFAPMILVEYLAALLALPFWMWVSDCTSKYRAVIFSGLWVGVCSLFSPWSAPATGTLRHADRITGQQFYLDLLSFQLDGGWCRGQ